MQHDGVPALEGLRVGDARVGHVGVDAARPMPRWASAAAAGDGLVVPETALAVEPEGEVVHAPLTGGAGTERTEDDVDDALRGENVARAHGGLVAWLEQGVLRDDECDGPDATVVERDVRVDHAAEGVDDCRVADCLGRVPVAVYFGPRAGEVEERGAGVSVDGHLELDGGSVVHVVYGVQRRALSLDGEFLEEVSDGQFGRVLDGAHVHLFSGQSL